MADVKVETRRDEWYRLTVEQTLQRLETDVEGISDQEAVRRLEQHGPNALLTDGEIKPLAILLHQVTSPLIYVLFVAGIAALLLNEMVDAGVIFAVVVLNSVVGFIQEYGAERSVRALAQMAAPKARVIRDGHEREIDASEVVPGDIVVLENGAKVPADLRLTRTVEMEIDESMLTGESLPVRKQSAVLDEEEVPIGDQLNLAFMGTVVVRGRGAGVAVETGQRTALGQISTQVQEVGEVKTPLQRQLDSFARLIAVAVVSLAAVVFILGIIAGETVAEMILAALSTSVAAIPEGLPVVLTVAMAVGVSRMAKRNAIIRRLLAVETLGSCTVICTDKTGTLTKNEMTVRKIVAGGKTFEVTGAGYEPKGDVHHNGQPIDLQEEDALAQTLRIGLITNTSDLVSDGHWRASGDPTEVALIVAADKAGLHRESEMAAYPELAEIPFDSDRRYMATLHEHGSERFIFVKGAPERVVQMCSSMWQDGQQVPMDPDEILDRSQALAAEGLRVLAMAYRSAPEDTDALHEQDVEHDLVLAGLQAMFDPPRPEAIEAVAGCKRAGIRVVMITGDHRLTAEVIAQQLGIAESGDRSLDGRELEHLSDDELADQVRQVSVYARTSPEHKLRIAQALARQGEIVAMTGDGVNDAPALKAAHIGIAMGVAGTDVAKEAADMVLADDNFASIYAAVEQGRVVYDNIRKAIMFLIPTGLGLIMAVIATVALRFPLIFLPAQVIWINLVTNGLQDVAMGFEPAEKDVGLRAPRSPKEGLYTRLMIQRTVLASVILMAGTLGMYIGEVVAGYPLEHARTMAMTTMVLFQNFHIFNSRSFKRSVFQINPASNRFLFVTITGALMLHILAIYWEPLQFVLRTAPLSATDWLTALGVASTVFIGVEIEKLLRRSGLIRGAVAN